MKQLFSKSCSSTGMILWSSWVWESGLLTASTRLSCRLSSALMAVLYFNFTNRWSYLHETDDEAAAVKCPGEVGRANQIASVSVSITGGQLHKRNRSKSYFHLQSPAAPGPGEDQGILVDNNMEMMVCISSQSYEIFVLL